MHGNQGTEMNHAVMGAEIYGNSVSITYNKGARVFDHRGGIAIIFNNLC